MSASESMELIECEQGTQEWLDARAGAITASMFPVIRAKTGLLDEKQQAYVDAIRAGKPLHEALSIAGYKSAPRAEKVQRALDGEKIGEWSSAAKDYAFTLACERISGKALSEAFETWQMRRGRELEDEARATHELRYGFEVRPAGFVRTPDGKFGCSADGLIETSRPGGAEYKAFLSAEKLRPILLEHDPGAVMDQTQGCMAICHRDWWHIAVYTPFLAAAGRELTVFDTQRDDDYIDALWADLWAFDRLVEQLRAELMAPQQAAA